MKRIFLYAHGGSGNHGCEAIVRATGKMLDEYELKLISANPEEDRSYGLDAVAELIRDSNGMPKRFSLDFVKAYAALKLRKDFIPMEKLQYKAASDRMEKGDIALSIGGDNYCYADVYKYTMFHEIAKARGAKTVLWGCSVVGVDECYYGRCRDIPCDCGREGGLRSAADCWNDVLPNLYRICFGLLQQQKIVVVRMINFITFPTARRYRQQQGGRAGCNEMP
jgi:hypothetical protein